MRLTGKAFATVVLSVVLIGSAGFAVASGWTSGAAVASGAGAAPAATAAPAVTQPLVTCSVDVTGENVGDNAIQTAINAATPGTVICIGPGTYPEQLTISTPDLTLVGAGNQSTILEPAAPLTLNTFDYDAGGGPGATPTAAIILVDGSSGTPSTGVGGITIEDLAVNASAGATSSTLSGCGDGLVGVDFQASSGSLIGDTVTDVELAPNLFGCQQGLAVYAYDGMFNFPTPHAPDVVNVTTSTISAYDKNGVTCDDTGVSCSIERNTITGIGPTTLIAQNGVQVGFGASAMVGGNRVSGDAYTPTQNVDYFSANEGNAPAGILVFDAGNSVTVAENSLSGDTQGISVLGTAAVSVLSNTIHGNGAYGITLDLNASSNYLYGYPVYSTATPRLATASDNEIEHVNVGYLVYDDNVSISGGSATNVNVSIESLFDNAATSYSVAIAHFAATANVAGALLGNVSSYQATTGFYPKTTGSYVLTDDTFYAGALAYPAGSQTGVSLDAASANVTGSYVSGFDLGLYATPTSTASVISTEVVVPASLGVPGIGIWTGNLAPLAEETGTFVLQTDTVVGPGGGVGSALAGGSGIIAGGAHVAIADVAVSGFSAVVGSGALTGYNWYQGTQSVGILLGCEHGATTCLVRGSTLTDNAIGVAALLTNSAFSLTYQASPFVVASSAFDESGGYGIWAELPGTGAPTAPGNGHGAPGTSVILHDTFDDASTGAPAMVLDGGNFSVVANVLIGTSASGDQGAAQAMPDGPIASCTGGSGGAPCIATASVEATDTPLAGVTHVTLAGNAFVGTTLYWSTAFAGGSGSNLTGGELVAFSESGLPAGRSWGVSAKWSVHSPYAVSVSVLSPGTFVLDVPNGTTDFSASVSAPYFPDPSGGLLTIAGAPLTQVIDYSATLWTVTFTESGLSARTLASAGWSVVLNGSYQHSTSATITYSVPYGTEPVLLLAPSGHVVVGTAGVGCARGSLGSGCVKVIGPTSVHVTFGSGHPATLAVVEKGLARGQQWCFEVDLWSLCSTSISERFAGLTPGSYNYSVVSPLGGQRISVTAGHSTLPVAGTIGVPHSETVKVDFVYRYAVTFTESGLASGSWYITYHGVVEMATAGSPIVLELGNGTYHYTIGRIAGFTDHGSPSVVRVAGAAVSVAVSYVPIPGFVPATTHGAVPAAVRSATA